MIVYIPPLFGNLIIEINEQFPPDSDDLEHERTTKLVVRSENTIRLGMREIRKLHEFEKYAEIIFDTIQALLFKQQKPIKNTFAECDISRTVYLVEHKELDMNDENLGARIHATDNKLTIITSSIGNIAGATEKYHFI
jgi:hypothetical protein